MIPGTGMLESFDRFSVHFSAAFPTIDHPSCEPCQNLAWSACPNGQRPSGIDAGGRIRPNWPNPDLVVWLDNCMGTKAPHVKDVECPNPRWVS